MAAVKIAFVASGGAARGVAHLGVLRACEELGLVPDVLVGTSAGALVGAAYAQDVPLDVLLDAYRLPWRRQHRGPRFGARVFAGAPSRDEWLEPRLLCSGLLSLHRLERYLSRHLPINEFRRLPRSLYVTAVDVDTGERVVFGRGYEEGAPVSEAVAAACCMPGIFRPYRIGDRYFVDGEVLRTVSADVAVAAGADVVIVSNVYRPERSAEPGRSLAERGLGRVLRQCASILLTDKERAGSALLTRRYPHVTFIEVAPDLGPYGYLTGLQAGPIIMRGYGAGLRALAAAKEAHVFDSGIGSISEELPVPSERPAAAVRS